MGTTAEKLTYLNETKSKIKDNINLTGAGLTNQTPFRQYATDLKTALLNILNNGIDTLYNNFPKTTGTGTNISLNNTLQAPIRSVINGDTQQDGTPTPDNPKEIKSVTGLQKVTISGGSGTTPHEYEINLGKNLFDGELELGGYDASSGSKVSASNNYRNKNFIFVQPNTTYTFSIDGISQKYVLLTYGESKNFIAQTLLNSGTFTTGNNVYYINFRCYADDYVVNFETLKIQLEESNQATSYSPYFTPIHLYEGDQIIGTPYNWSIYRVNGEVVLNGSETWTTTTTNTTGKYRNAVNFSDLVNDNYIKPNSNDEVGQILSNYYTPIISNTAGTYGCHQGISLNTGSSLYIYDDTYNTNDTTAFKTWLSTHNTKVVYELATPTTTPITNTELIEDLNNFYNAKSYNGTTNISVQGDLPMILDVSAIIGE